MISFSSFLPKQWKWDYLTVLFTLLLITYIPITSQYWIFYHAYPPFHHLGYFLLHLFFDFCILNLYINYFLAMFTHPGRVPAEWVPRWITDTNPSGELIEVKKSIQKPRFCRTCNQYKPPRSHHCRQCQQCILKMDHHCPWVNNCIGHLNLAYFLRFLLFVNLSTTLCGIGLIHQCYILFVVQFLQPLSTVIILIINTLLCVGIWISVGILSMYHFYYLFTNTTTIESMERDRQAYFMVDGSTVSLENIYNIDLKTNLNTVFGDGPISLSWLVYGITQASGLQFKYRIHKDDDIPLSQLYQLKKNEVENKKSN